LIIKDLEIEKENHEGTQIGSLLDLLEELERFIDKLPQIGDRLWVQICEEDETGEEECFTVPVS